MKLSDEVEESLSRAAKKVLRERVFSVSVFEKIYPRDNEGKDEHKYGGSCYEKEGESLPNKVIYGHWHIPV